MPIFRAGAPVKFKTKKPLSADLESRLHATDDGYLTGIYFPAHEARTPEVRDASGKVAAEATAVEVPECIYAMTPGGHNLMVPVYGADGHVELKKLTFSISDVEDVHDVDHVRHMPPGRTVHKDWKPVPRKGSEKKPAEKPIQSPASEEKA